MGYRNLESIEATITSYLDAFNKMRAYCGNVECSASESNSRSILPTQWRPTFGQGNDKFRKDANYLSATHAKLLELGKARFLAKGYWDYDSYFKVSWQIQFPFKLYEWEIGNSEYTNDDGKTIPSTPTIMKEWCSPQYLCLGEISGWGMKSWALPDWWAKHTEIESFMDDNPILKDKYREVVKQADKEVETWQKALREMNKLSAIFEQLEGGK